MSGVTGYLARIELPGDQKGELYEQLHASMKVFGFVQFIKVGNTRKRLPHATYVSVQSAKLDSLDDAYEAAKNATILLDNRARIIVFERGNSLSKNLRSSD